ncbi:MAG: FAD-dependent oxidoreductase [Anaerolineaceae bacterium]
MNGSSFNVAIIGAGPAGIFSARELINNGVSVVLFNRDIKPGGLAEYGIYPDKIKMKEGLRKQFASILELPELAYYGNVSIGSNGDFKIEDIRNMGFDAILVTTGAQGTKWLNLKGEKLTGVFHAKDIVYYFNKLPPFSTRDLAIGRNVVIIGVGNVMMDVARYLIHERHVNTVTAFARRGPAEVKFTRKEFEYIGSNFDLDAYKAELDRVSSNMVEIGQDPLQSLSFIMDALQNNAETKSKTKFRLKFLSSPRCILGDENDKVVGIEMEENLLVLESGKTIAKGLGNRKVVECDTVIFAIGDSVDPGFGLPIQNNEFVKNPNPRFPVDDISYECFDPIKNAPMEDIFLAGWARNASNGLVGIARKDGINASQAILRFLSTKEGHARNCCLEVDQAIRNTVPNFVTKEDVINLENEEKRIASAMGLEYFKFLTNAEMLYAIKQKKIIQP